mmetsp:Transcript_2104/g.4842  ORF Transcript_2104/g.4842 Transcript_2104/m.4842 type:complete len:126 (-) Transcript_2104:62-439(-)
MSQPVFLRLTFFTTNFNPPFSDGGPPVPLVDAMQRTNQEDQSILGINASSGKRVPCSDVNHRIGWHLTEVMPPPPPQCLQLLTASRAAMRSDAMRCDWKRLEAIGGEEEWNRMAWNGQIAMQRLK